MHACQEYLSHVVLSICVGNRHLFPNQTHMKRYDTAALLEHSV